MGIWRLIILFIFFFGYLKFFIKRKKKDLYFWGWGVGSWGNYFKGFGFDLEFIWVRLGSSRVRFWDTGQEVVQVFFRSYFRSWIFCSVGIRLFGCSGQKGRILGLVFFVLIFALFLFEVLVVGYDGSIRLGIGFWSSGYLIDYCSIYFFRSLVELFCFRVLEYQGRYGVVIGGRGWVFGTLFFSLFSRLFAFWRQYCFRFVSAYVCRFWCFFYGVGKRRNIDGFEQDFCSFEF